MAQQNILRVKNEDGSFTTLNLNTSTKNVTNEDGKTVAEILAEDVAKVDHVHKYQSDVPSTVALGGLPKGYVSDKDGTQVEDLLFKLLHPYVKPTINYSCNPNGGTYEIGTAVPTVSISATGVRQSDKIQQVRIYKDGTAVVTQANEGTGNCTATYTDTNITQKTVYKADVYDGTNTVASAQTTFNFVRPAFVGALASDKSLDAITSTDVNGLSKKVMSPANIVNSFTLKAQRMCIALPTGWTLKNIMDPNGFDITKSFAHGVVKVMCADNSEVNYTVYVSDATDQTNFKVTFNKA